MVALERGVQRTHVQRRLFVVTAHHNAVGLHEVIDGRALFQKLRVADHAVRRGDTAFLQLVGHGSAHHVGRAHRHRALVDDHLVIGHVFTDVARGSGHVLHVGRAVLTRRGAHRNELDSAEVRGTRHVGGEVQATRGHIALHHLLQARLIYRDAAVFQNLDLGGIHIQAQHVVAHLGQASARHQTHITCTDNSNFHRPLLSLL